MRQTIMRRTEPYQEEALVFTISCAAACLLRRVLVRPHIQRAKSHAMSQDGNGTTRAGMLSQDRRPGEACLTPSATFHNTHALSRACMTGLSVLGLATGRMQARAPGAGGKSQTSHDMVARS